MGPNYPRNGEGGPWVVLKNKFPATSIGGGNKRGEDRGQGRHQSARKDAGRRKLRDYLERNTVKTKGKGSNIFNKRQTG